MNYCRVDHTNKKKKINIIDGKHHRTRHRRRRIGNNNIFIIKGDSFCHK